MTDVTLPLAEFNSPRLTRLILKLAIPSVIGLSAHALHQIGNAFFISRLGTEAVSAISLCFPIAIILAAIGEGAGVGVSAFTSRMLGANQPEKAHQAATTVMALLGLLGILLTLLIMPFIPTMLTKMGATPHSLELSIRYTQLIVLFAPLMLLQILCDFIAISEGNTRFSMWTLIGSFALNLILDPIFIFTFNMGITGAAWATGASQVAAILAYFVYFRRRLGTVRIAPKYFKIQMTALWQMIAVGVPAALSTGLASIAYVIMYHTAGSYGDNVVAAIGISFRILAAGTLPVVGFCLGAQALLGFSWGAENIKRFRQTVNRMLGITSLFTVSYSLLVIIFAPTLIAFFTQDPTVASLAILACRMFHLFFAFFSIHMVAVVTLQITGKAREAAWLVLAPQGYCFIPFLFLLPNSFGIHGLLACPPIAAALSTLLAGILLFKEMSALKTCASSSIPSASIPSSSIPPSSNLHNLANTSISTVNPIAALEKHPS
ncbi:MAG: MATE family efflux transporter [Pseudomonadota bacterium]